MLSGDLALLAPIGTRVMPETSAAPDNTTGPASTSFFLTETRFSL
jgi:hypothetical protein